MRTARKLASSLQVLGPLAGAGRQRAGRLVPRALRGQATAYVHTPLPAMRIFVRTASFGNRLFTIDVETTESVRARLVLAGGGPWCSSSGCSGTRFCPHPGPT